MNEQALWLLLKILPWLLLAALAAWLLARWRYKGKRDSSLSLKEQELSSTHLQLNQLQNSSDDTQKKLSSAQSELAALRKGTVTVSELEKVQQTLQKKERDLSEAQSRHQSLNQQIDEAKKKHSDEVRALKDVASQLVPKADLTSLQNQLATTKQDLAELEKSRDQLQQEAARLKESESASQRKYHDAQAQLEQLKKESSPKVELEQLHQAINQKDRELQSLRSKSQELESQVSSLRESTVAQSEFEKIKQSLSTKDQELETTNKLKSDLEAELHSLRDSKEQLHLQFNSLQKVTDQAETLRLNLAEQETANIEKQTRLQQLDEELHQAHARENELQAQIHAKEQALQTLRNSTVERSQLEQLQQHLSEQQEAVSRLTKEQSTLKARNDELDQQLKAAQEDQELLQLELEEKQTQFQQTQGGHQELQGRVNQLQEERGALAQSLTLREQTIEAEKTAKQQLQSELTSAAAAQSKLEQKLQNIEQENARLLADLKAAEELQQLLKDDLTQAQDKVVEFDQIRLGFTAQQESQQKLSSEFEAERYEHQLSKQALSFKDHEYEALQLQLDQARTEAEQLQLSLTEEQAKQGLLLQDLRSSQEASVLVKQLQLTLSEKDQAHTELQTEQQNLRTTLEESQANLQALNEKLPALQEAETAREQLAQELKTANTERDKLIKQFETANVDLQRLKEELVLKKKNHSEAESVATKSANELKNYKIKAGAVEEQLRISIASKNQANELLNAEIKTLRSDIEGLNKQLTAKDKSITLLEQKLQKPVAAPKVKVAKGIIESGELALEPQALTTAIQEDTETDECYGLIYRKRPQAEVDDLELINGVGPKLNEDLNEFGIYYFQQIASWNDTHIAAFQDRIGFPDRINREQWVLQAQRLWDLKKAGQPLTELHYTKDRVTVDDHDPRELAGSELQQKAYATALKAEDAFVDPEVGVLFKHKPVDADDLTLIKGVADVLNQKLHQFGIYYFKQIALWSKSSVEAFQTKIGFKDRILREKWIQQCRQLHKDKYNEII